ncbi:MAG: WG repeat-containing protein [Ferruginibacter sp.]|nr:WG repeat-containing protein [Ferruginibacter sp.]
MTSKKLLLAFLTLYTIPAFAQEPDMSLIPYRKGNLWGYAAADKNIVVKPEYEEANLFYEGFAVVKKGGKYGYINKEGKVVIPIKYFAAKPFKFGYYESKGNAQKTVLFAGAAPQANGYEICIDTKGAQLAKCPAISENSLADVNKPDSVVSVTSYSTIQKSDLFDKIAGDYKIVPNADETYYIATRNGNYGVFNNKFEVIVPFEYNNIEKMNVGPMIYLKVEKAGAKGIFFGTGSPYLAVENSRLDKVKAANGKTYFIFTKDGQSGLKDTKYQNVVETIYSDIAYDPVGGGFILTAAGQYKGYFFPDEGTLLPRFAEVKPLKGAQYVMVKNAEGKWGYVSNRLLEFFEE